MRSEENDMKAYFTPNLEYVQLHVQDVIATSSVTDPEADYPVDDLGDFSGLIRNR